MVMTVIKQFYTKMWINSAKNLIIAQFYKYEAILFFMGKKKFSVIFERVNFEENDRYDYYLTSVLTVLQRVIEKETQI